jgi:hypothetical protein
LRAASAALTRLSLRERADLLRDALLTDLAGSSDDFAGVVLAAAADSEPFDGWPIRPVTRPQ